MLRHPQFAQSEVETHRKWLTVQAGHLWHTLLLPSSNLHQGKRYMSCCWKSNRDIREGGEKKPRRGRDGWHKVDKWKMGKMCKGERTRWSRGRQMRSGERPGMKGGTPKVASEWDGAVRGGMMKDGRRELVWKRGDGWEDPLHACGGLSIATELTAAQCVHKTSARKSRLLPWSQGTFTNTWAHPGPRAPTQTSVISTVYNQRDH